MAGEISAEAFERWYTPKVAVERLGLRTTAARKAIAARLSDGLLRAAATTFVERGGRRRSHVLIGQFAWREWSYARDRQFWEAGDTDFLRTDSTGYGSSASGVGRAYGVRLDPKGIEELRKTLHPSGAQRPAPMPDYITQEQYETWLTPR
jgi:hypothetical protein